MANTQFATGSSLTYLRTHPHITFKLDLRRAPPRFWAMLFDAAVRCDTYPLIVMEPDVGEALNGLAARRGALASAKIEGNTLSRADVARLARGELNLPERDARLGHEVKNILDAFDMPHISELAPGSDRVSKINSQWYKDLNALVMRNIPEKYGSPYGAIRTVGVQVGGNHCPPAEECDYLLDRLFDWLGEMGEDFKVYGNKMAGAILQALVAHLYAAWIHPFTDGNGRSSRLLEYHILTTGGIRSEKWGFSGTSPIAAHRLAEFYWNTRTSEGGYYDQLARSYRSGDDGIGFLTYAVSGFAKALAWDYGVFVNNDDSLRHYVNGERIMEERDETEWRAKMRQANLSLAKARAGLE